MEVDVDALSTEEVDQLAESFLGDDIQLDEVPEVEEDTTTEDVEDVESPEAEEESEEKAEAEPEAVEESDEEVPEADEEASGEEEAPEAEAKDGGGIGALWEELSTTGVKANGSMRRVRSADHLKSLVQIAFGATEKNRLLKPYLKQFRSLEQAGIDLTDTDAFNTFVGAMKGDKAALKALVIGKHGVDEETLLSWVSSDNEAEEAYVPENHLMSDNSFELRETLEDMRTKDSYNKVIGFLGNLDDAGKTAVSERPELAKFLSDDMETGLFDIVMDEAKYRMDSGKTAEQSELLAYIETMQDLSTLCVIRK